MRHGILQGACIAAAFLVLAGPLSAQPGTFTDRETWWLGYAVNAPLQLLGVGTAVLTPRFGGWGLYADVKISPDSPARGAFRGDLTPDQAAAFGDIEFDNRSAWTSVNAALVKTLGPQLAVYVGGGLGERTVYVQFTDHTMERHESGIYWVEDETQAGTFASGMVGAFFRLSTRFIFQMGAESAPAGFTAGIHIVLR